MPIVIPSPPRTVTLLRDAGIANAELTKVSRAASAEDYDSAAGTLSDRWVGSVDAYYQEERELVAGAGEANIILRRWLTIENSAVGTDFSEGDTVTFIFRGTNRTGTVQMVERREFPLQDVVDTTRLTLEDA